MNSRIEMGGLSPKKGPDEIMHEDGLEAAKREGGVVIMEEGDERRAEFDIERFKEYPFVVTDKLQRLARVCASYLSEPILADNFNDHEERRKWRNGYDSDVRLHLEKNRLRANHLQPVEVYVEQTLALLQSVPIETGFLTEIRNVLQEAADLFEPVEEFKTRYFAMPVNEKIPFIKSLSEKLRAYVALVSKEKLAEFEEAVA